MATLTPAERTGIDNEVGSLTVGKQADIVLLSKTLQVKQVYINGLRCSAGIASPSA
jgi:N-acetylglucosamine-6-phosphate deacetylase